jgi:glutamine amidotransferase
LLVHLLPTGSGNLRSLVGALEEIGHSAANFEDEFDFNKVNKVIIPGVGSFAAAMRHLQANGLEQRIKDYVESGRQVLGICLGMQILAERGMEHGEQAGIGLISGTVMPFRGTVIGEFSETHVGFNNLEIVNPRSSLLKGVSSLDDFYFTHSFYLSPTKNDDVAAFAQNGVPIAAVVDRDGQVFGTQFHPEKSQSQGLRILKNFVAA